MGSHKVDTIMNTVIVITLLAAVSAQQEEDPIAALSTAIPGSPGEDYPIYSSPPETSFLCDGFIEGYYADPEAECQAFHICANFGSDDLTKYSFLCPNGTLFNQQYFICDWWFNVDCSQAEDFYSLNEEVAAAAAAATAALVGDGEGEASNELAAYSLPAAEIGTGVLPTSAEESREGKRAGRREGKRGGKQVGRKGGKAKLTLFG